MKHVYLFVCTIFLLLCQGCNNPPVNTANDTAVNDSLKMSASDSTLQAYKIAILLSVDEPDLVANKTEVVRLICMRNADDKKENSPGYYAYRVYRNTSDQYTLTFKYNPEPENKALIKTENVPLSEQQYLTLIKIAEQDSLWEMTQITTGLLNTSHETLIAEYVDGSNKKYHLTIEQGKSNKYLNQLADSLISYIR